MTSGARVGVDIGGTFTDVVCRTADGHIRYAKFPTTRQDESIAVLDALKYMAATWNVKADDIVQFAHGTTVATNAVLECKGATIGLITTAGFRDQLEIGRQMRHELYNINLRPETPGFLVPGARRKEARERLAADGSVLLPLSEDDVIAAAEELHRDGAEAIAICFLFSFRNPAHELRARDLILRRFPDIMITLSHEVDPAFREYERLVVTAFDAYVKPVVDAYLRRLEDGLRESGVSADLQVMQSRGGLMASPIARKRPVRLMLSGPAAGVIGGQQTARATGIDNLITVDIGGTSCDIALVTRGKSAIRAEARIDRYPMRVPMVDVNSIGAGGGSIGRVDRGGMLRVGPQSAGSEPGPACYGRGGMEPTITDASLVLGYIDPEFFAAGMLKLDRELAYRAIDEKLARPLKQTVEQAALGMHRLVNAQMAEGIRLMSIRQGIDPRPFAILPMGGGGGIHATALARILGMTRVVAPRFPGVLSAIGLLEAPIEHEVSAYFGKPLRAATPDELREVLRDLDRHCSELMADERVDGRSINIAHAADLCYVGQSFTLEVPLDLDAPDPMNKLYGQFLQTHDRVRGHAANMPVRIVNLRTVHRTQDIALTIPIAAGGSTHVRASSRTIILETSETPVEARVVFRDALAVGDVIEGPAIVEQHDTTILIETSWTGTVDRSGAMLLTRAT